MEVCLGMIGMRPEDFWNSSMQEIYAAAEGFKNFNSPTRDDEPMSRDRLNELMELYPD
jgi:hypothetical protein